ncbi:hypothetical protein Z517_01474 [Fonsecaea pedrosoi CBS 271.37]|uniref:Uncharacterized protein n=1 Tax=Fonsecaea pedrosoi CBS 271.37 TaxID=1442368 RepID=A0A0D2H5E8_9EURO|nr:uncharacterized protein Z517_01474 [Fonsecaea pedrosoi CBS 271.37]KIW86080.1 hypothetical protein Z517_01474 [Fonsecaea pedrosoi CBS 271.37]
MSSSHAESSTNASSTLSSSHEPQEATRACGRTQARETDVENVAASVARDGRDTPSTGVATVEHARARCPRSQTRTQKTVLGQIVLLFLCVQIVAVGGLALLAQLGSRYVSAWLFKHSTTGFYIFFFTQAVGMQIYYHVMPLSTAEGSWTRFLEKCAVFSVKTLIVVVVIVQMVHVYCSIAEHRKLRMGVQWDVRQEFGGFERKP